MVSTLAQEPASSGETPTETAPGCPLTVEGAARRYN
jgi:hypothetical protein